MTAIPLRRRLPGAFGNLPGRPDPDTDPGPRLRGCRAAPIRSCSRWGLPCRLRCRRRGALLPHRFTLAEPHPTGGGLGGLFSVALSLGLRPPDVIRHRMSMEPGLSSRAHLSALARAAVQPTDVRWNGGYGERGQAPHANQALGWIELRSSRAARSVLSVAMVDTSITPSMRSGRKWRWNAATASRVAPSR